MSHHHPAIPKLSSPIERNVLLPSRYVLLKQNHPYLPSHLPHRATKDSYATLEEARISIAEYLAKNYTHSQQLGEPPGRLCGYEVGIDKCLGMAGGEILGRVWVETVKVERRVRGWGESFGK